MAKNGTSENGKKTNGRNTVESTFRAFVEARKKLQDFVYKHNDVFSRFAQLTDDYNHARALHVGTLKAAKTDSPLFRMIIPKRFICPDLEAAQRFLKERFAEFVSLEPKVNTQAVRNAIAAETLPGIEMIFVEVEDTPRHTGPKEIDLSALRD